MKKIAYLLITALWPFFTPLQAEIQQIIMIWDAPMCLDVCIPIMNRNLRGISGISDFQIDPKAGTAVIQWNPLAPFNFQPFNVATRSVGTKLLELRLKVRGTITHDAQNVYLVSIGDNTRFTLIGPLQISRGNYTIQESIFTHPLQGALKQQFLDTEVNKELVTVQGRLFEPFRYDLTLIAEQVQFPPQSRKS